MQSGSSDAGNAAVLLLRLGKAKHVLGDLEGALKDLCSGNQAQPRKKCSPASIRQDQAGVARWHKQQGGKSATTCIISCSCYTKTLGKSGCSNANGDWQIDGTNRLPEGSLAPATPKDAIAAAQLCAELPTWNSW